MHQFNKMLSSAGHAECNQSAIACMAMRHRRALLTLREGIQTELCFTQRERATKKIKLWCYIHRARCLMCKQKSRAVKERSQYTVIFNWYRFDVQKSVGNSHIYMFSGRRKSSWGANGIISSLLNAMKVIFRCISGIYLMWKTKGFEVIRAGFFFLAV